MQNLTLQQLFGRNATQTTETLTIYKADLPGLSADANNRSEQLLVALLLQAHQHFEGMLTDEQSRTITDDQGRAITYDNKSLYEKLALTFWKRQFISRNQQNYILDTFVINCWIKPPTEPGVELQSDSLVY